MEKYLNTHHQSSIENMPGCHKKLYQQRSAFNSLPAHRMSISKIPQDMDSFNSDSFPLNNCAFSKILRELVSSALQNANKVPTARRYSEVLTNFSMYMYILSGTAAYEVLAANLPLPKVSTIREHLIFKNHVFESIRNQSRN